MMQFRRVTAGVLLVAMGGCTTTRLITTPGPYLDSRHPGHIMVETNEGKQIKIMSPRVLDDTIFGFNAAGSQFTMPLSSVKQLRASETATGKTIAFGVAAMAAIVVITKAVIGKGSAPPPGETPED